MGKADDSTSTVTSLVWSWGPYSLTSSCSVCAGVSPAALNSPIKGRLMRPSRRIVWTAFRLGAPGKLILTESPSWSTITSDGFGAAAPAPDNWLKLPSDAVLQPDDSSRRARTQTALANRTSGFSGIIGCAKIVRKGPGRKQNRRGNVSVFQHTALRSVQN